MSQSSPFLSIIVPTHGLRDTLRHTLASLADPQGTDIEILVVANYPSGQAEATVSALKDPRIRLIRADRPLAMADNWELGWRASRGQYVAFLGDDDAFLPGALAEADRLLRRSHPDVLHWRRARYWWPDAAETWHRNRLAIPLADFHTREIDARTNLEAYLRFEADDDSQPMVTNAFVRRQVLEAASLATGRLFCGIFPDWYSAIAIGLLIETFESSGRPFSVAGRSRHSIRPSLLLEVGDTSIGQAFLEDYGHSPVHSWHLSDPRISRESMLGLAIDARTSALELMTVQGATPPIDRAGAIRWLMSQAMLSPMAYGDATALAQEMATAYGLPSPAMPPVTMPSPVPPGQHGDLLWVNADATGARTCTKAAALAAKELAKLGSGSSDITSPCEAGDRGYERPLSETGRGQGWGEGGILPQAGSEAIGPKVVHTATPDPAKPLLRWIGPFFHFSGYSAINRSTVQTLAHDGQPLTIMPTATDHRFLRQALHASTDHLAFWHPLVNAQPDAAVTVICNGGGDDLGAIRQALGGQGAFVGLTMHESTGLPPGWAEEGNAMDEVWVPSSFNAETFAAAGIQPDKLRVIPMGIDTRRFDPDSVRPYDIPGRKGFTFLSVFQWSLRKGWDVLIKAYLQAFRPEDDVCLAIRAYPAVTKTPGIRERIREYVTSLGHDPDRIPTIVVIDEFVPDDRLPDLYAAADAYVLPSRGEGIGYPYMEAMAMGLPVIGTRWSGQLEFMTDDNSYLIDVERLATIELEQIIESPYLVAGHQWAEPDGAHLATLMRRVFDDRAGATAIGQKARQDILEHWDISRTARWVSQNVQRLAGTEPEAKTDPL